MAECRQHRLYLIPSVGGCAGLLVHSLHLWQYKLTRFSVQFHSGIRLHNLSRNVTSSKTVSPRHHTEPGIISALIILLAQGETAPHAPLTPSPPNTRDKVRHYCPELDSCSLISHHGGLTLDFCDVSGAFWQLTLFKNRGAIEGRFTG